VWDADFQLDAFYRVLKLQIIHTSIHIGRTHGLPKFDKEYWRRIMMDEYSHIAFYSFAFFSSRPVFLALIPICVQALLFVTRSLPILINRYSPTLRVIVEQKVSPVTNRGAELMQTSAMFEVLQGFSLIAQLLTPYRNFLILFIYWQYLRMRYMLSEDVKLAFSNVKARTDSWAVLPFVPAVIRTVYYKLCDFMWNMVDPAQQAQQSSSCVIM